MRGPLANINTGVAGKIAGQTHNNTRTVPHRQVVLATSLCALFAWLEAFHCASCGQEIVETLQTKYFKLHARWGTDRA
jgi:hypothetical protein